MAYLTHMSGEQLPQTKKKAKLNFDEVVSTEAEIVAAELVDVNRGGGLEQFREACRLNFVKIALDVAPLQDFYTINDGDLLWDVRDKLNKNFEILNTGATNMVADGVFADGADWTLGDGWSIGGGVANFAGAAAESTMVQDIGHDVTGTPYKVTFTVSGYGSLDGTVSGATLTDAGTGYTTADDHDAAVTIEASTGGGTLAEGTLVVEDDVVTGVVITEAGTLYKGDETITLPAPTGGGDTATATLTFTAGTPADSTLVVSLGGTELTPVSANGTYTEVVIPETTVELTFTAGTDLRCNVDNVVAYEYIA